MVYNYIKKSWGNEMKKMSLLLTVFLLFSIHLNAGNIPDYARNENGVPKFFIRDSSNGPIIASTGTGYEIDALTTFGSGSYFNSTTINAAIKSIGTTNLVALTLAPGNWVMNANVTIPPNITLKMTTGALITTSGYTLTISGPFEAGMFQVFTGNGFVSFGEGAVEAVYPEWWGARGNGTVDCTAAINSAISSLPRGTVKFAEGTYKIVTTIMLNKDRVNLIGQGPQATILSYAPKGPGTAVYFYKPGSALVQSLFKGFGLNSSAAFNFTKVAFASRNAEDLKIEDVAVYPWNGNKTSVGFQSKGKHMVTLANVSIRADIPISIEDNPDSTIDIDHYNFHNTYLIADVGSCVQVSDGVNLTNVTFDGYQAWVPKTFGFYWRDTTTLETSANLSFKNIRIEQETDPTAYLFYISHKTNLYNVLFENIYGGLKAKGFYLRKCPHTTLKNVIYYNPANNEALNADATVSPLVLMNCFWQGGSTFSTGNLIKRFYAPDGSYALPRNAIYGVGYHQSSGGNDYHYPVHDGIHINNVVEYSFTEILPNNAYSKYIDFGTGPIKFLKTEVAAYVNGTKALESGAAVTYFASGAPLVSLGGTQNFSLSDTAGKICIIRNPSDFNLYRIKNRLGDEAIVHVKIWVSY
jgi:hypothetical protein